MRSSKRFRMSRAARINATGSASPARRLLGEEALKAPLEVLPDQRVRLAGELPALQPFVESRDQQQVGLAEIVVARGRPSGLCERKGSDRGRLPPLRRSG